MSLARVCQAKGRVDSGRSQLRIAHPETASTAGGTLLCREWLSPSHSLACLHTSRLPGLPEEVAHTKQCLARGYAVLALRSLDREYRSRCFSSSGKQLSEHVWGSPGGLLRPPASYTEGAVHSAVSVWLGFATQSLNPDGPSTGCGLDLTFAAASFPRRRPPLLQAGG